jgi:hypothetical protein
MSRSSRRRIFKAIYPAAKRLAFCERPKVDRRISMAELPSCQILRGNVTGPAVVGSVLTESPMCWQCEQIDREIEHYRGLFARITDQRSAKGLEILIAKLEAEKNALHVVEFKSKTVPPR